MKKSPIGLILGSNGDVHIEVALSGAEVLRTQWFAMDEAVLERVIAAMIRQCWIRRREADDVRKLFLVMRDQILPAKDALAGISMDRVLDSMIPTYIAASMAEMFAEICATCSDRPYCVHTACCFI